MPITAHPIKFREAPSGVSPTVPRVTARASERAPPARSLGCLLVAMPFVSAFRPSIQIGLLAAIGREAGHRTSTLHANLDLAAAIGLEQFETLCAQRARALGDWLFSTCAFGDRAPDPQADFLTRFADELPGDGLDAERLLHIRDELVPAHVSRVADGIDGAHDVIGFTSTFQQNVASIALARELKSRGHRAAMLFGGANFEDEMGVEYVRAVDAVDYAVSGEADTAFVSFLDALAAGRDPSLVDGVIGRGTSPEDGPRTLPPHDDLDALPVPDYDEYFDKAVEAGITGAHSRRSVYLPFESSRGCWWGERKHCTFCGLNGGTMKYRAKGAARLQEELVALNERYRGFHFEAVDNILERSYLETLFPTLEAQALSFRFFFEVKSNLSKERIAALARAGVERVQPGIESLSTDVLRLMDKGVTAAANVNFLRWCRHYGIRAGWNVLWGFPGELAGHHDAQAELFGLLHHLDAPNGGGRVWLERFSPMFRDVERFPLAWRRPEASYAFVYPDDVDLERAAYFFDYEFAEPAIADGHERIVRAIAGWQRAAATDPAPSLSLWNGTGLVQVEDRRDPAEPVTHTWPEPLATAYRACMDRPVAAREVVSRLPEPAAVDEVVEALDEFVARGVMMKDENRYLALALPARGPGGAAS